MRPRLFSLVLTLLLPAPASAQLELPDESRYIYRKIPDVLIQTAHERIRLSELYRENPLLLTLVYSRCSGICYPYLKHLHDELNRIPVNGFRVLVLSFDPGDDVGDMVRVGETLNLIQKENWIFGVTQDIDALSQSVGFNFEWREPAGELEHPALVAGVGDDGYVLRILAGFQKTSRLAEMLREMQGEFIPSYPLPEAETTFRCLEYDPVTGEFRLGSGFLILFAPASLGLTALLTVSLIIRPRTTRTGSNR